MTETTETCFVLGGEIVTARTAPDCTVLEWLRASGRTGTKEGCAEGDCGACTVAVGERVADGSVTYRAINSCIQFMPALAGHALVTVEDLAARNGTLHPVQQAMVDHHASQCGFCTPGFVMSLFAMHRTPGGIADDTAILDGLAGNLCRCTGYRPILDAARALRDVPPPPREREAALLAQIAPPGRSLAAFAAALAAGPSVLPLGGATDLGLLVTKRHQHLDALLPIAEVAELSTIVETEDALDIGAGVTFARLLPLVEPRWPSFGAMLRRIGSAQIRNSGTVGGNIANASPIGDTPPPLIVLGATLVLHRAGERREIPLDEFFLDYRKTALRPGEFIERIRVPKRADWHFWTRKVAKRFDQDISAVVGAFAVRVEGGMVRDVRIAYGGMAATPKRALAAEAALLGAPWGGASVAEAADALDRDYVPIGDMRASAGYRRLVARNLLLAFTDEIPLHEQTGDHADA
jgi:xanthine dehydrogenase small subunit